MWRVGWPLADSFTLLVYSWALDLGLWNKKTLCSPLNGIRHGLPKGPPWSLAWRVQTLSKKRNENVCEEMMDKYCYICIYIYTLYICVCLYTSIYMCIFMLRIWWICLQNIIYSILCMQYILQMWAIADCACTCRHWGCMSVFIGVCHSQNTLKGNILKFRISLQVKLRLQVVQFCSQLYILQCHWRYFVSVWMMECRTSTNSKPLFQ